MFTLTPDLAPQEALTFRAQTPGKVLCNNRQGLQKLAHVSRSEVVQLHMAVLQSGMIVPSLGKHHVRTVNTAYVLSRHPTGNMNFSEVLTAVPVQSSIMVSFLTWGSDLLPWYLHWWATPQQKTAVASKTSSLISASYENHLPK
jgi:hypothetical protein